MIYTVWNTQNHKDLDTLLHEHIFLKSNRNRFSIKDDTIERILERTISLFSPGPDETRLVACPRRNLLNLILSEWERHPEYRFGQLLCNLLSDNPLMYMPLTRCTEKANKRFDLPKQKDIKLVEITIEIMCE
jgi:hypothetical protein